MPASMRGDESEGGVDVPIVWRGRRASAFVPTLLANRSLEVSTATARRTATAEASLAATAASMPDDHEPLARMLLRAEGVASSFIEGVTAPIAEVLVAEFDHRRAGTPAGWVASNLAAVTDAVDRAHEAALTVATLCDWQRAVVAGSPLPERHVGVVRDEQGWIGGTSPLDAALVTPPPERLPELLDDLVAFVNRNDVDSIAQTAIAHAQFEIIHPFADGNGRVGRVLVAWMLARRLALVTPPPVSIRLAADRGGYLAGLTMYRLGQHEPWVRWFAEAVVGAGDAQRDLIQAVDQLTRRWREQLGAPHEGRAARADALAWRVLELMPRHLMLTAAVVASESGATTRAATSALDDLVRRGILVRYEPPGQRRPGRPPGLFVSPQLLGIASSQPL